MNIPNTNKKAAGKKQMTLPRKHKFDFFLLGIIICLLSLGITQVFSASTTYAFEKTGDNFFFFNKQLLWMGLGSVALFLGYYFHYQWMETYSFAILGVAIALLIAVLIVGHEINYATRWIRIAGFTLQPSELAKPALIIYLATYLRKKSNDISVFKTGFLPPFIICGVMVLLLLKQPDLGISIILATTTVVMLFVAGTKLIYIFGLVLVAIPGAYLAIVETPWRMKRFLAFLNPEAYQTGAGYQTVQSRLAIGSGELFGTGLGSGRQQLGYLPEIHNDFILASIGENLGFLGIVSVFILFMLLIWRGIKATLAAPDMFSSYLAFGITFLFGFQVFFNGGVVLGVLPSKGLTLPFISYGGSSLMISMFLIGVLLNIGHTSRLYRDKKTSLSGATPLRPKAIFLRS